MREHYSRLLRTSLHDLHDLRLPALALVPMEERCFGTKLWPCASEVTTLLCELQRVLQVSFIKYGLRGSGLAHRYACCFMVSRPGPAPCAGPAQDPFPAQAGIPAR